MSRSKKSFGLRSLQARLTVFVTVIATLVLTASGTYDFITSRQVEMEELRTFTQRLAERSGSILERPLWNVDRPAVSSIIETEMKDKRIFAMMVVEDNNQRVFYGRMRDGTVLEFVPELSDSMLYIKEPIVVGDLYIGAVLIYVTPEYLQKELAERVMSSVLQSLVLVSVVGVLLVVMVRRIVLRPLSRLSNTVGHIISAGDYSIRTDKETNDEFGSLADSFNTMVELIETREAMLDSRSKHLETLVSERTEQLDKARLKAEEASRAKSEFVANMSHELRTPMNAIIGMIDITHKTELTPKQAEYLRIIKTSARSLLGIVNDILDFSKIEAQKLDLESIPFSLHNTLEEVTDMFSERISDTGAEFIVDIGEDVPDGCQGDPLRLRQVLVNLINNAFKFTEQGEICLHVKAVELTDIRYKLQFSVRDTGVGIENNARETLFDMFTQADGSTTRKYGGTGLGLAISRELVGLMGGDIHVKSSPGEGSNFIFTVVFAPAEIETGKERADYADVLKGKRVLLVEDNASNRHVIEKMLRSLGLVSTALGNGEEALAILQEDGASYDVVLMDWRLPGMNGLEVLDTLRLRQVSLPPVLLMTAFGRDAEVQQADELGVSSFLMKPVKIASLQNALVSAFGVALSEQSVDDDIFSTAEFTGVRVLLVEDNIINQQVAREVLESEGLVVETADHGEAALEIMSKRSFDVIFMDIQMPGMDGFETTRRLRERPEGKAIPIIAMTAHVMSEDKEAALAVGMNDYLTKPIDRLLLFTVLRKWVGKAVRAAKLPPSLFVDAEGLTGCSLSDKMLSDDDPADDSADDSAGRNTDDGTAQPAAPLGTAAVDATESIYNTPDTMSVNGQNISLFGDMPSNTDVFSDARTASNAAQPAAEGTYPPSSIEDANASAQAPIKNSDNRPIADVAVNRPAYDSTFTASAEITNKHADIAVNKSSGIQAPLEPASEIAAVATPQTMPKETLKIPKLPPEEPPDEPLVPLPDSLPGLDVIEGVNRISGKLWLYRTILEGFLANYRETAPQIATLLEKGEAEEAERLAHTVAGAAGNVSAVQLREACLYVENKVRKGDSVGEGDIAELARVLAEACQSMESLIPHLPEAK